MIAAGLVLLIDGLRELENAVDFPKPLEFMIEPLPRSLIVVGCYS
jgi:hypothetical protein